MNKDFGPASMAWRAAEKRCEATTRAFYAATKAGELPSLRLRSELEDAQCLARQALQVMLAHAESIAERRRA